LGLSIETLESRTYLDAAGGSDDRWRPVFLSVPAARTNSVGQPAALAAQSTRAAAVPRAAAMPLLPAQITGPREAVARGDNAVFTVTLTKAPGVNRTVSVKFTTVNGSARAGVHYTAQSGVITFRGNETVKTITVETNPLATTSRFPKPDMFSVTLSKPNGIKLTSSSATATIRAIRPGLSISPAAQALVEGNSGTVAAVFDVSLVRATAGTVTVDYATVDGSATVASNDYQARSGTLTFAPGETVKQVTVNVVGDVQTEGQERFALRLQNASNNTPLVVSSANVYIVNDDVTATPPAQVNIEMVTVEGNLTVGDPARNNLGVVSQPYQIGKYEITNGQYASFLNNVAKIDDRHTLWNADQNIARLGNLGSYSYAPKGSGSFPIFGVSWLNAARFTNWMHNGQSTDPASTSSGVYDLPSGRAITVAPTTSTPAASTYTFLISGQVNLKVGDPLYVQSERRPNPHSGYARVVAVGANTVEVTDITGNLEDGFRTPGQPGWYFTSWSDVRSPDARYWLPNRDEWHRAAYHDPETIGLTRRYWETAVRSSSVRGSLLGNGVHHANEYGGWNGLRSSGSGSTRGALLFSQYGSPPFGDATSDFRDTNVTPAVDRNQLLTPVGGYLASPGFYGTFDQTGNVSELLETLANGDFDWQAVGNSAVNNGASQWNVASHASPKLLSIPGLPIQASSQLVPNTWVASSTVSSVSWTEIRLVPVQTPQGTQLQEQQVVITVPLPAWNGGADLVGFRLAAAPATAASGSANVSVSAPIKSPLEGAASGPLAAAVAFTISLDRPSSQPVFVFFATANGTATAGSDYVARSGLLVFEPGVVQQTVHVSLINDGVKESQETFSLKLSKPINAKLALDTAVVTIIDDD
jgi:formylglycine-generating enzyme required for sulfatase activity